MALDQARRGLGGPYGGDARGGQPPGDGHLALGPVPQFRVPHGVPADLDHQVADGEHRVLTHREQLRTAGQPGGGQHLTRTHLVHDSDFRIRAGLLDEPMTRQHDDGGRLSGQNGMNPM
ncbi:hypothetical protein GCM10009647_010780 [Streptomyces sanglieri]